MTRNELMLEAGMDLGALQAELGWDFQGIEYDETTLINYLNDCLEAWAKWEQLAALYGLNPGFKTIEDLKKHLARKTIYD